MAINLNPFANKAELNVEVGKTTADELGKFQAEAEAKGGGQIRAKQNKDGSFTLYVAANRKIRLAGSGEKAKQNRLAKQELAQNLIKDIILRRLPAEKGNVGREMPDSAGPDKTGRWSDPASDRTKALLQRIDQRAHTEGLKETLNEVAEKLQPTALISKFSNIQNILQEDGLRAALLGQFTHTGLGGRNITFGDDHEQHIAFYDELSKFSGEKDPNSKMAIARRLCEMLPSKENPDGINVQGSVAEKIRRNFSELEESIGLGGKRAGKEISETDRDKLDSLFTSAKAQVGSMYQGDANLKKFLRSETFRMEIARIAAADVFSGNEANPARHLPPGLGKEYREGIQRFSVLDNILSDVEMRSEFREHLESQGKVEQLDFYEQVEKLVDESANGEITDAQLLAKAERLFLGDGEGIQEEVDKPDEGQSLSLDEGLAPEEGDAHRAFVSRRLGELKTRLQEANELMGIGDEATENSLFGTETPSTSGVFIRGSIVGFLEEMRGDAANAMRPNDFHGFRGAKLDRIVADRLGHEQLEWQADAETHYGAWEQFRGKELAASGGATGSGRAKVGKQLYQVKGSIEHSGFGRRLKAGGLNHENYGEVIASNLARAMIGEANRNLIPEVSLRHDAASHEAMVTSRYLANGQGDMDDLYVDLAGEPLPKGQKHAKIVLHTSGDSRTENGSRAENGTIYLDEVASKDVLTNIALSAIVQDHDVNPGNMIAVKGGRIGRIDFGHAFAELINGPGGAITGGGGFRNEANRILDFFNRETISGVPFTGQTKPKLWRDFTGGGPSLGMAQAMRSVASNTEAIDGLVQAKTQFVDLIADLEAEGTPEAQEEMRDLIDSLARICTNIGHPIQSTEPGEAAQEIFQNLESFIRENQAQMREVADLCELQAYVDAFVTGPGRNAEENVPLPSGIETLYGDLLNSTMKTEDGMGINWMKSSAETPAFSGNLRTYIQARRIELQVGQ